MARKKPMLSLRRPSDSVDPLQAERFVRGLATEPTPVEAPGRPGVQTSERPLAPDVQTPERPSVRVPERPSVQAPAPAAAPASKSLVYRKRTDDLRRRMTIYLSEDLSRRLRVYAAEQDQDYSVVLAEALGALLDRKGVH